MESELASPFLGITQEHIKYVDKWFLWMANVEWIDDFGGWAGPVFSGKGGGEIQERAKRQTPFMCETPIWMSEETPSQSAHLPWISGYKCAYLFFESFRI